MVQTSEQSHSLVSPDIGDFVYGQMLNSMLQISRKILNAEICSPAKTWKSVCLGVGDGDTQVF